MAIKHITVAEWRESGKSVGEKWVNGQYIEDMVVTQVPRTQVTPENLRASLFLVDHPEEICEAELIAGS